MKRKFKGFVAAVIALIICVMPMLSVIAAADEQLPRIWVHGFMNSTVYENISDPNSGVAWPPSAEDITNAVKESVPAFSKLAVTGDWDSFGKEMGDITRKVFDKAMNNPDGTVKTGSGVRFEYPTAAEIKSGGDIQFRYDWREDPIEIAAQLNDFINYVLDVTKKEQVTLTCHSFGGVVTVTYFSLYGFDKVKTVVFNSTAIYGETYTGELMTGQLNLNADALQNYLFYAFQGSDYENLINTAIKAVHDTGLMNIIAKYTNAMSEKIQKEVCARAIVPLFGGWLAVWAMIPDEYLDDAMDFVFNEIYGDSEIDYSALRAKIENYNTSVRCKKTEILKEANEKCNVYVITRYGYSSLPITPSANNLGDGIIDVKYASFGATASEYGKTLDNIDSDSKYISPDKTVDASSCLFPEQTWFVKNIKHGADEEALENMIRAFMDYDGQATVEDFEEYPRFTIFDGENILPEMPIENQPTFFDNLRLIINDIIKLAKALINKIK